jgi:hypothetical protein
MKRSEMVKILADSFWKHMNCDCCETDEIMYDTILKELEEKGMLPPPIQMEYEDLSGYTQYTMLPGWEDEKK